MNILYSYKRDVSMNMGVVIENVGGIKEKALRGKCFILHLIFLYLLAIFMNSFLDFFIKHIFISNLYLF